MYDLKITRGTIVDGTGNDRFTGDVAVADGRIVDVGRVDGPAKRTIDADGAIVAPGFVDVHTHYDGQVSWDRDLAPSCFHGVTTAIMGSCGVGFAPVRPTDHERLIELMEGVEDIPGTALAEGITWAWSTFPEYMDALDEASRTMDFGLQVPHDALRVYVMGERALADEVATDDDIEAMRGHLREALIAGALGFTTGRSDNHRDVRGGATPASEADRKELAGLSQALRGLDHGVLQAVSDFDMAVSDERFGGEFDLLEAMAEAAPGHRMSISLMQRDQSPLQWQWVLDRVEQANARGLAMRVQTAPRGIGVLLGLEATFNPFMGFPSYQGIADLPLAERVATMRRPDFRARLLQETTQPVSDNSSIPPLADQLLQRIDMVAMRLFRFGEVPNYEPTMEESIYAEAFARKVPTLAAIYDALLEDEGRQLLYFPLYNYTAFNLDHVRDMLTHRYAIPGLSDGGAHVGTVCDASFPTFLLQHWTRDRDRGRISLERAIKMQAHDTARHMGLVDRGTIAVGQKADLNVIDHARLQLDRPRLVGDLPAGGKRLIQRARGYLATIVSGAVTVERGELTGVRPGRLVRGGGAGAAAGQP
ncbi:MAG: amidohydrolase family protein [Myxococcota bacterium]